MSDETTIPPALSAEQWQDKTVYFRERRVTHYGGTDVLTGEKIPRYDEGYGVQLAASGEMAVWDDSWGVALLPQTRHAVAALALYGQPFGFTQEDVAWLRRMEFSTLDRAEAERHQAWFQSFLARHLALLPPSP